MSFSPIILMLALLVAAPTVAAPVLVPASVLVGDELAPPNSAVVADGRLLLSAEFLQNALGYSIQVGTDGADATFFGHRWQFKIGALECKYDSTNMTLDAPVLTANQQVYLPAKTLLLSVGASVTKNDDGRFHINPVGVHIGDIRQGIHSDKVRMVVDVSSPTPFDFDSTPGTFALHIPVKPHPEGRDKMLRQLSFKDQLMPSVTEDRNNGISCLTFRHQSRTKPLVMTLGDPTRIVIDFDRPEPVNTPAAKPTSPVSTSQKARPMPKKINGVEWRLNRFGTTRGPVDAWSVIVNPRDAGISIRPAMADSRVRAKRTVASIAGAKGAYAAINGGFFSSCGEPLGLVIIDGEWISQPLHSRAALGFLKDGRIQVRNAAFDGWVNFEGLGRLPMEGINQDHTQADGVVAYTPRWGDVVLGNPRKTRVVVEAGIVKSVLSRGENAIMPRNGYIVSGLDRRAASLVQVRVGQAAKLELATKPAWDGLSHAIGGGPRLLDSGKAALSTYNECFRSDVLASIRPRTAAGVAADGNLILLVVDNVNKGMTLNEVASVMRKLGAVDAMNLDGGGSTTLVIDGQVMNRPSDGTSRSVSNALVIIDQKKS